jgi:hypothetical protein
MIMTEHQQGEEEVDVQETFVAVQLPITISNSKMHAVQLRASLLTLRTLSQFLKLSDLLLREESLDTTPKSGEEDESTAVFIHLVTQLVHIDLLCLFPDIIKDFQLETLVLTPGVKHTNAGASTLGKSVLKPAALKKIM